MKAPSIRQPRAELIVRGDKAVEARPMRTTKRGERVLIYAGKNRIETMEEARIEVEFGNGVHSLPRGVLVKTVEIVGCEPLEPGYGESACFDVTELTGGYAWLLGSSQREDGMRVPSGHTQPSLFTFSKRA